MGSYALDYSDLGNGIDMSTVDPNPSVDQSIDGTDGGASQFSDVANVIGKWGSVIGSVLTNTPIVAAQTTSGAIVPIGARGSTVAGGMSSNTKLLLVAAVVGVVVYVLVKK
jgi:hypothetical protein